MPIGLVAKSNGGERFISDANRKSVTKRHKWHKGVKLTNAPAIKLNYKISKSNFIADNFLGTPLPEGVWPILKISDEMDLALDKEPKVMLLERTSEVKHKSSTTTTQIWTPIELDEVTFPNGVESVKETFGL